VLVALGMACAVALAACGSSSGGGGSGGQLRILAASSLQDAFPKVAAAFAARNGGTKVSFEFAGSDELATQIEEGAKADVFAAASPKYPNALAAKGDVSKPVAFATNTLVAATPARSGKVTSLAELSSPGLKLVIGAAGVPVGDYTRQVLTALDATEGAGWSAAVMGNVVSEEQSVKSIVAKLASGDADAGFVYTTDVKASAQRLTAIAIPPAAKPSATYPIAVVSSSGSKDLARKWVDFVRSSAGQQILQAAGFGPPPAG
jgi:molybdate transport system substrate-binding protein